MTATSQPEPQPDDPIVSAGNPPASAVGSPRRGSSAAQRNEAKTRAATERANELARVGLTPGEAVRFRRRVSARWIPATVERLERDGSVGLRDPKGAAVALTVDRIEVRTEGPRGRLLWEPLTTRLARSEQLRLL